jgi:hypothetical protein
MASIFAAAAPDLDFCYLRASSRFLLPLPSSGLSLFESLDSSSKSSPRASPLPPSPPTPPGIPLAGGHMPFIRLTLSCSHPPATALQGQPHRIVDLLLGIGPAPRTSCSAADRSKNIAARDGSVRGLGCGEFVRRWGGGDNSGR